MMGTIETRVHPETKFPSRDLFEVDDDNGYRILSDIFVNDDVLSMILSHLTPQQLIKCRLVCKNWCDIIDSEVWKLKLHNSQYGKNHSLRSLSWHFIFWILHKECLNKNLVQNHDGSDQLKHWKILSNGGNKWKVEAPPCGTNDLYPHPSCFVTSFNSCSKEQVIDLAKEGAVPHFMDEIQPEIVVSEWYAGRFDCRAIYDVEVNLVTSAGDVVDEFKDRKNCGSDHGIEWNQVSHTFRNYGAGVRYIRFFHGGVDEQFWAGHYGSKMTGASVQLVIP